MPSVSAQDLCKLLEREGYELKRQKGSHRVYFHSRSKKIAIVPMHPGDLKSGVVYTILKQLGRKLEDL